jgi:Domain of unknown function (DUF4328)
VEFRPLRQRAKWAINALVAVAVLDVVAVWADWDRYGLLGRIVDGGGYTLAEATTSDNRESTIALLQILALMIGALFFIRWFLQAYRNVDALGGTRDFAEKWAGWAWFVPILSLWRPKQIANEIWRAGDPDRPDGDPSETRPLWGVLALWWACWIASNFISQIAARTAFRTDTSAGLRHSTAAYLIGDSIDIASAVLAIAVILRITARQEERAAKRTISATA